MTLHVTSLGRLTNRLITGGINHVSKNLFRILYATSLRVTIAQEDELALLTRPQTTDTLLVDPDQIKTQGTMIERDYAVLVHIRFTGHTSNNKHYQPVKDIAIGEGSHGFDSGAG